MSAKRRGVYWLHGFRLSLSQKFFLGLLMIK